MSEEAPLPVLYKQNDAWSLPSSSAASIQVEVGEIEPPADVENASRPGDLCMGPAHDLWCTIQAYMRFTGVPFQLEACATNSKSPTGEQQGPMRLVTQPRQLHGSRQEALTLLP